MTRLRPVRCCYCGAVFTPEVERDPRDSWETHQRLIATMQAMLDDGLPLECGKCRTLPHMDHDPMSESGD